MYVVLYEFQVKPDCVNQFISSWTELTNLIYKHEDSLGSRLHKKSDTEYLAYAQWPSKDKFELAGGNLPARVTDVRNKMKSSCTNINVSSQLEVVKDLLAEKPND